MPAINGSLDGNVAFVSGAASGIGRATALAFARERANVVVADIDQRRNQNTVRMIQDLGGQALAVNCDVTRGEDVQSALTQTVERFGRLNYAFNNAGAEQQPKPTADITEEEWDRIISINLRSVFLCLKYEIPLMLEHAGGAIVNSSSGAGIKVFGRGAAYAAAKHAAAACSSRYTCLTRWSSSSRSSSKRTSASLRSNSNGDAKPPVTLLRSLDSYDRAAYRWVAQLRLRCWTSR